MEDNRLPMPGRTRRFQEHPVAQPGRAARMLELLPDAPAQLEKIRGRHFVSAAHLDRDLVMQLFRMAASYEQSSRPHETTLSGQIVVSAFLDQVVNQTRVSFDSAAYSLGASVMAMDKPPTGAESDTGAMVELAEMFNAYGDVVVLKTQAADSFDAIVEDATIPVINAGNGELENPSQALVDLYTLFKWKPELMFPEVAEEARLQVGFFGAPGHTRTTHSLLILMGLFPWAFSRVVIFGRVNQIFKPGQRERLEAAGLNIETTAELYKQETMVGCLNIELPRMDVVYSDLLKPLELSRVNREAAVAALKPDAMVLCPSVHLKEFGGLLDDSPHNAYFNQARNAVFVRMAVLQGILGRPESRP